MDSFIFTGSTDMGKLITAPCGLTQSRTSILVSANGHSSLLAVSSKKNPLLRMRWSVIAAAKKERRKKVDNHSFAPKPDEATGFFPEAVLLKQRKVQEDGKRLPEFADAEERMLFESLNLEMESDMDLDRRRHYEVVYLIHENKNDEVESVNMKVQEFLEEKKGKVWRVSDWGLRKLAYKIQKATHAHYILMNFEMEAKWINDFKDLLDRDERVIRHLVMKMDMAETEECPAPPDFTTLRAGMDDDEEDDNFDYDGEYDDEYEEEEAGEDEEDGIDLAAEDDDSEGVIFVDDDATEFRDDKLSRIGNAAWRKQKAERVGR